MVGLLVDNVIEIEFLYVFFVGEVVVIGGDIFFGLGVLLFFGWFLKKF